MVIYYKSKLTTKHNHQKIIFLAAVVFVCMQTPGTLIRDTLNLFLRKTIDYELAPGKQMQLLLILLYDQFYLLLQLYPLWDIFYTVSQTVETFTNSKLLSSKGRGPFIRGMMECLLEQLGEHAVPEVAALMQGTVFLEGLGATNCGHDVWSALHS